MSGRPHPAPNALHTWEGFSTGRWEGDALVVRTTHLKPAYVRRNGLPRSEKAVLTERFVRVGNYLTWISVIEDPVYLTEPLIRSRDFYLDPGYQVELYSCSIDVEIPREAGDIPHYVDQNPDLNQYAEQHGLPRVAVQGGAETTYPEFEKVIRAAVADDDGAE